MVKGVKGLVGEVGEARGLRGGNERWRVGGGMEVAGALRRGVDFFCCGLWEVEEGLGEGLWIEWEEVEGEGMLDVGWSTGVR